ncbi:MAG: sn-glycerol-3-phosphate transporter [Planctomycetota bacterium]|nr:MAG: sn-glycerol-3-phosphate transporter [Planctomycetota bacterium]
MTDKAVRDPYRDGRVWHPRAYRWRRFLNWFPLGLAYAMLYMGRYNLTVAQGALSEHRLMPKDAFGDIFGVGALVYGCAFLLNGPLTDRIGGRRAMLLALFGACGANLAMGWYTRQALLGGSAEAEAIRLVFMVLYGVNMYFQSFGAVSIVKVNASWFHVRERGGFSGIFGIMISSGIFFAFDVNERVLKYTAGSGPQGIDPTWLVFFVPAAGLLAMLLLEAAVLRDVPSQAGHADIHTGDATADEDDRPIPTRQLMKRILTHPIILTIAAIEFCSGVLRNGVMHWFRIYAKEQQGALQAAAQGALGPAPASAWSWALENWGLLLMIAGILGGNFAGWVSDKLFHSRRAPAAALLYGLLTACTVLMFFSLDWPWVLVGAVFFMSLAVIGVHGLLSGTATMDFGGRKGAATAVGIIDGFVYLGTAVQSVALGRLTKLAWIYWPAFLLPFAVLALVLLGRIWHAVPSGGRKGGH